MGDLRSDNEVTRAAWDANAAFWDERMGEGNDWFNMLVWPCTEELLGLSPGQRVLDIACGNGLASRRMAAAGAEVVAFDFSEEMISAARRYGPPGAGRIDYHAIDATDREAMLSLGPGTFDAALCMTALFDIAEITPLMQATFELLRPGGRFVFSLLHPCFNNPSAVRSCELEERGDDVVTTYSVKVSRYMTPYTTPALAMPGQSQPHLYFHRPLGMVLAEGFRAGFVLDALEERAFPPNYRGGSFDLSWNGRYSEIPPMMIARLRRHAR